MHCLWSLAPQIQHFTVIWLYLLDILPCLWFQSHNSSNIFSPLSIEHQHVCTPYGVAALAAWPQILLNIIKLTLNVWTQLFSKLSLVECLWHKSSISQSSGHICWTFYLAYDSSHTILLIFSSSMPILTKIINKELESQNLLYGRGGVRKGKVRQLYIHYKLLV